MFIGHIAVGLAAKRVAPKTSLGLLVAAPLAVDLLWPIFVLAGVERVRIDPGNTAFTPLAFTYYPWSHSLLMSLVWSVVAGAAYWLWRRYRAGALVLGAGVFREKPQQITNTAAIEKMIDEVLAANPKQVDQYRAGKTTMKGFFVGQVMKMSKGTANPTLVNEVLEKKLS